MGFWPILLVFLGPFGAIVLAYLVWKRQREERKAQRRPATKPGGTTGPRTYVQPPPLPEREKLDVTQLGPPRPDQVAGYKTLFNAALEEERFDDAAHIAGLLRTAGEETWADNAVESIENARKRAG